jgi:hypothetical protein
MAQEKIHVGARVPKDIVDKCVQKYGNMTNAINASLELLIKQMENETDDKCQQTENTCQQNENNTELIELKIRMEEKDIRLKELYEQIKTKDSLQEARINDLLDQLKVKDQQLEKKDSQMENLTNTMQSQAINIHDMLNQKAIEAPGEKKKPFWKFW